jgi:hypothetical protein
MRTSTMQLYIHSREQLGQHYHYLDILSLYGVDNVLYTIDNAFGYFISRVAKGQGLNM